jgi:beta-galactosidase
MSKRPNDYARFYKEWHEEDATMLARRDRNHPSVFMWSIGNEIKEQKSGEEGAKLGKALTDIFHREDPTRLTTCGNNNLQACFNGFASGFDVLGLNYKPAKYAQIHKTLPQTPLLGSETPSCISSRGEYFFPVEEEKSKGLSDFQVSSYDLYAPGWATTPESEFTGQDQNPCVFGGFVWTGFDYLGEPTPYNKDKTNLLNYENKGDQKKEASLLAKQESVAMPSRSSYFGILDLCGFKKDRFYLYQSKWRPELPMVHLLPHWNWHERIGQVTPVHVYTSGDEVELFLNGKSLGRKKKSEGDYRLRWSDVSYQPGELKAVAYKNGKKWAEETISTTGAPSKIVATADRSSIASDGLDLSYITLSIADGKNQTVPRSNNLIKLTLEGPGEIVAVDNGDATSLTSFQAKEIKAFNGLCLAIVRFKPGHQGELRLTASSEGLQDCSVTVTGQ